MKFKHFFLPHPETHQRAYLISTGAFALYLAFFIVLQMGLGVLGSIKPEVLGLSSKISVSELVNLTNQERIKAGLPTLTEDNRLDAAAKAKGENMFAEQYWAHYSPSGKDPWGFIQNSGYKFTYAGENLARNFNSSSEVVTAWMNSPTHKENVINSHYQHIGMAVLEGTLNGQTTILVVQEFGSPVESLAKAPLQNIIKAVEAASPASNLTSATTTHQKPINSAVASVKIDPFLFTKYLGIGILSFILLLIIIDLVIIKKRAVTRLSTRNFVHIVFITAVLIILFNLGRGIIG